MPVTHQMLEDDKAQLRADNERLRAALAWYAETMNWVEDSGFTSGAVEDGGKIARKALVDEQNAGRQS